MATCLGTTGWYFCVPTLFIVSLGLESALGHPNAGGNQYRDFRAVAHWFDPVFFQYNLVMALLVVLVVPSLALKLYAEHDQTERNGGCNVRFRLSAGAKSAEEWGAALPLAPIGAASG